MTTNPRSTDTATRRPIADVWDVNFPTAMKDLLRDEPSLVVVPLLPDSQGRQRFLVHKPDESGQMDLGMNNNNERKYENDSK
jgi:hypothetical protein